MHVFSSIRLAEIIFLYMGANINIAEAGIFGTVWYIKGYDRIQV